MMRTKINYLKKFAKDEGGNLAITLGLALTPIMMSVGLTVDYTKMEQVRSRLQESADAAALYAFTKYRAEFDVTQSEGNSQDALKEYADQMSSSNYDLESDLQEVELDTETNKITVKLTAYYNTAFMGIAGFDRVPVSVISEVTYSIVEDEPLCVYSKGLTGNGTLELNGSSDLIANGCAIHVNSSGETAVNASNATTFEAESVCVNGGVGGSGTIDATVTTGCDQREDVYAKETQPDVPECHETSTFSPSAKDTVIDAEEDGTDGVYVFCAGVDMGSNKSLTLNNGIFVFQDSWLEMDGNADLIGENAVLYFTGTDVGISMTGNSTAAFSGRKSGTLQGFSIYFDPDATVSSASKLWGGSTMDFEGVMYFGEGDLELGGNTSVNSNAKLSLVVANRIELNGSSELHLSVEPDSVPLPPLVEGTETLEAYLSK